MGISNHQLQRDFPQFSDLIEQLVQHDGHFQQQLTAYSNLDREIESLELQAVPVSDERFTRLKIERAHLKDALYHRLEQAAAN